MAGGASISVRQIAAYPLLTNPGLTASSDLVLVQQAGLGGPYATVNAATLVANALQLGPALGVGYVAPPDALGSQVFGFAFCAPLDGGYTWNGYNIGGSQGRYWTSGVVADLAFDPAVGLTFNLAAPGQAGTNIPPQAWSNLLALSPAGALSLPHGTLTVARDPASALEVATMRWVGNQTVASFNNRKGVVTLNAADIYGALGICPPDCIATTASVNQAICAAINELLRTYPAVWSWMGRVGDVFLTVADMNFAAASNPPFMPPLTIPTPPSTVIDGEVVTAAWVIQYLSETAQFATEDWVNDQIAASRANSVISFNGRVGAILLQLADITGAGGAPINGPNFSGVPTAPTAPIGTDTGQIATTAFVTNAVAESTAGVSSFNTRTGAVVLTLADIEGAGGAPIASPSFSGTPSAPTASPGTSTTQIATTQFVEAALGAQTLVTTFNGRSGAVVLTTADITGAGGAPIASPNLTGNPTAPTPPPGDSDTSIATTAFVQAAITAVGGVSSFNGRSGTVVLIGNDISAAGGALLNSPAFSGTPSSTTPTAGDNSTRIATTAFVDNAIATGAVLSVNGRNGAVTIVGADITGAGGALLNSPAFTGVPTGPTAAANTTTTQLATTAFVMNAINALPVPGVTSFNTRTGAVTLTAADVSNVGGALLASPTFTGSPSGPTASPGTNSTQLATTAFVTAAIAALPATGVTSWNTRTGAVTFTANDISAVGGALLASPVFTGVPTAPTAAGGTSTDQIASTAFVMAAIGGAGGVLSWNGRTGAVTLSSGDLVNVGGALLASPNFTGAPTAPTASPGDSSTLLATTAFVQAAITSAAGVTSFNGRTGAITLTAADVNAAGGPYATTAQLAGYLPLTGGTVTGLTNFSRASTSGNLSTPAVALTSGSTVMQMSGAYLSAGGNSFSISAISGTAAANLTSINLWSPSVVFGASWASISTAANTMSLSLPGGGALNAINLNASVVNNSGSYVCTARAGVYQLQNAARLLCFGGANAGWALQDGTLSTTVAFDQGASNQWIWMFNAAVVASLSLAGVWTAAAYNLSSDANLKNTIAAYAPGVSIAAQLSPKTFVFNNDPTGQQRLGFVAQDVEPVLPDAVSESTLGTTTSLSLDVTAIVAVLANAVKQLLSRIEALESAASITPTAEQTA